MNKQEYNRLKHYTDGGAEVLVEVKDRGSNNPYGRKASKYAGSRLRAVRCTGTNRVTCTASGMKCPISLSYQELWLREGELLMTNVVRRERETIPPAPMGIKLKAGTGQMLKEHIADSEGIPKHKVTNRDVERLVNQMIDDLHLEQGNLAHNYYERKK